MEIPMILAHSLAFCKLAPGLIIFGAIKLEGYVKFGIVVANSQNDECELKLGY